MDERGRKRLFKETFDAVSGGYDHPAMPYFPAAAGRMAAYLDLKGREHVLDAATGTGNAAFELARRLPEGRVTGVDFSRGMLQVAEAKKSEAGAGNVEFFEMDMTALEFPDDTFDAAVSAFAIFFVDDMAAHLRHLAEKVKRSGVILATTFAAGSFSPLTDLFLERLSRRGLEIPPMSWKVVSDEESCCSLFRKAGLLKARSSREDFSCFLKGPGEWWEVLWNAGYRGLLNQLLPGDLDLFREEHLREIEPLASGRGIPFKVEVLFTSGTVP